MLLDKTDFTLIIQGDLLSTLQKENKTRFIKEFLKGGILTEIKCPMCKQEAIFLDVNYITEILQTDPNMRYHSDLRCSCACCWGQFGFYNSFEIAHKNSDFFKLGFSLEQVKEIRGIFNGL